MPLARDLARVVVVLACAAFVAVARPAGAQSSDADKLFTDGVTAMHAGDYATACPRLAESYRLDPRPGGLFTLAECEAAWGKLSDATAHYRAFLDALVALPAERRDKFEERRVIATQKLAALGGMMPGVTVEVADGAPSTLVVKRNGAVVDWSAYGVTKKVDPGEYVVTAEVDGAVVWERTVKLVERDSVRVAVPWPVSAAHGADDAAPSAPHPAGPSRASSSKGRFVWASALGSVGIVGVATGAVAGILAVGKKGTVDSDCPGRICNAEGNAALSSGRTLATVSTAAFGAGAACLAGAAIILVLPSPRAAGAERAAGNVVPSLAPTPGGAAFSLQGTF